MSTRRQREGQMPQILKEALRNSQMTTKQVARWLQITTQTVSKWAKLGIIPATQDKAHHWEYSPNKIRAWEYVNQELLARCGTRNK